MSKADTRQEDPDFLQHTYKQLWLAAGAHEADAEAVAEPPPPFFPDPAWQQ